MYFSFYIKLIDQRLMIDRKIKNYYLLSAKYEIDIK